MNRTVASKGILGLETNAESVKWSFGVSAPPASRTDFDACRVRLRLEVAPAADISPEPAEAARLGKYHYFLGEPGADRICYRRPFVYPGELALEVGGLLAGAPRVRANRTYHRYVQHRFMNLHSVGYVLTDLAALLLLRDGLAPLHASAFRLGGATVVVFAPPNTGKTLTTMTACLQYGADFLAEDLAITDGRTLYGVPWTSTFRYYGEINRRPLSRLKNAITRLVPPAELLSGGKPDRIDAYLPPGRILDRAPVTHVVLLERGPAGRHAADPDEALRKIANLNRYEFNYAKSPVNVAYEFFNPRLDLALAGEEERGLLSKVVQNAEATWIVRAPTAPEYAPLILEGLA